MTLRIFSPVTGRVFATCDNWKAARQAVKEVTRCGLTADIKLIPNAGA